jgi:5-methylcytosine-specific restriction protein A
MPQKSFRICSHLGCPELTRERYCEKHKDDGKQEQREYDKRRGSSSKRGYNSKWNRDSKRFLEKADNQFCYIRGPRCTEFADCKEHIIPPKDKDDPLFDNPLNHAPGCIACNSWKGHRTIQQLVKDESVYYQRIGYNPIDYLKERGLYY